MKKLTFRLTCFILLINHFFFLSFAQTKLDSSIQTPTPKPEQHLLTECDQKGDDVEFAGLEYYEKLLSLCRAAGNKVAIASILRNIGNIHLREERPLQSLNAFEESLSFSEALGDKSGMIRTLIAIGTAHEDQDNFDQASEYKNKALMLSEALGDKKLIAQSLRALGELHRRQINHSQTVSYFQKELKLQEVLGNKNEVAALLINIGDFYGYLEGDFAQALKYSQMGLKIYQELENKAGVVQGLTSVCSIRRISGYSDDLDCLIKSLRMYEELQDKNGAARLMIRIAGSYGMKKDRPKMLEYSQRALRLEEELGRKSRIADTLEFIGGAYLESPPLMIDYFLKSLAIRESQEKNKKNNRKLIWLLQRIADIYLLQAYQARSKGNLSSERDNFALAIEYYQKRLKLSVLNGENVLIANTLRNLREIYFSQGKYAEALQFAERAAVLAKQTVEPRRAWFFLLELGSVYRVLGKLDNARLTYEEAINIAESSRINLQMSLGQFDHDMNSSGMALLYESYIDLLMRLHKKNPTKGYDALALQANERARARILLELLNEARTDIRQGVDPKLLERERSLQQQLNEKAEELARLPNTKQAERRVIQVRINSLIRLYRDGQAEVRRKSPRYAALTQPVPLTVREIQRDLLDPDTVLLEYGLGGARSYLWVVTPTSLNTYELPNYNEIEKDVRRTVALLNDGKRWASDEKINAEYLEAATSLSRKLLPPALLPQLKDKRLIIVSDAILQYLPFGALLIPSSKGNTWQPLIVENEIVSLPSASTLAVLRRETANRKQAAKSVAIFADPVFSDTDERLRAVKAKQPRNNKRAKINKPKISEQSNGNFNSSRMFLERAFNLNNNSNEPLSISRLPFSRREAEDVLLTVPKGSWLKAVDFHANREMALSRDLSSFRIVHFATHGVLNSENPELTGLVLSLFNEEGDPVDGFLRLNEIYNMKLASDLVVLSACQTALGREVRGEGLIGLTRGFMYAGSPRVVASLWKVDDVATAELMKLFYQKMLKEKMRPAAALRAAKVEMWKQKRWNAPFYWAAFELQGEWR